ncbi:MAG: hypothetical protein ACFBZ9_18510 [Sphingomonadales bacterium]
MSPAETLRAAKALIQKPENWCQGAYVRDKTGREVAFDDPLGCQWCAEGAVYKEVDARGVLDSRASRPFILLRDVAVKMGATRGTKINDTTDHPTVMRMFDLAIEMAEEEE